MNNKKDKPDIPVSFLTKFQALLDEMEKETNSVYELSINENGYMSPVVLNKLDERTDVTLYVEMKMEPYDYSALNGEYGSIETIKAKVTELQFGSCDVKLVRNTDERLKAFAGWEYLWVCPKCNSLERNGTCNNLCQHCSYCVRTKWDNIHMSRGDIYIAGGGSISICHPIGKYKMIKKQ